MSTEVTTVELVLTSVSTTSSVTVEVRVIVVVLYIISWSVGIGLRKTHVGSGVTVVMRNEEQAARAEPLELGVLIADALLVIDRERTIGRVGIRVPRKHASSVHVRHGEASASRASPLRNRKGDRMADVTQNID